MTNLTILTGAGISAESGIPTFRDMKTGLWENHSVDDVATPQGFEKDPALVNQFYNERRAVLPTVLPNKGHEALVELEEFWTVNDIGGFLLITQNIDDLHERAGSKNVCHMHGELLKKKCHECGEVTSIAATEQIEPKDWCPSCKAFGSMRPDVVWFGEMPLWLDQIEQVLDRTNLYAAIGTSGNVMPASLYAECVARNNFDSYCTEITMEPTDVSGFDKRIDGKATESVPEFVDALIKEFS